MKIVIDIPDDIYQHIAVFRHFSTYDKKYLIDAFKNCTALPENHGRLIDLDALCDEHLSGCYIELEEHEISEIPVIIEGTEGKK